MSTWKPTEGARRAGDLVCDFDREARANGWPIRYLMLVRMQERLTEAIDQALSDGAEQRAIESMVGKNGHAEPWWKHEEAMDEKVVPFSQSPGVGTTDHWPQIQVPATADPVGADLPPESDYSEVDIGIAEHIAYAESPASVAPWGNAMFQPTGPSGWHSPDVSRPTVTGPEAPLPKKRGRPKGSTNKGKKKAKAAKAKAVSAPDEGVAEARPEDAA